MKSDAPCSDILPGISPEGDRRAMALIKGPKTYSRNENYERKIPSHGTPSKQLSKRDPRTNGMKRSEKGFSLGIRKIFILCHKKKEQRKNCL